MGASAATRAARFPDDEGLEASAVGAIEALRGKLRPYAQVLTAPARAARETAQALGFNAEVEIALRDCDYGRWRGLASKDVAEREPDGFAAWLGDPAAAPHGGESLAALIERVGAWLTQSLARESATLAVTHASIVRAAIVNALGAGSSPSRGSMSRRFRLRDSAVTLDAGILWRSGLWEGSRERRADRPHCGPSHARFIGGPSASNPHPQRPASGRRLHTESHAWPDGGDPRQSARDPGAGRRQAWVRPDDLAAGGLSQSAVLRLSLGNRSRQHHGRGKPVQRMRPCLSRRWAGAPLAACP